MEGGSRGGQYCEDLCLTAQICTISHRIRSLEPSAPFNGIRDVIPQNTALLIYPYIP
jgi:hypothetical protein